MHLQSNPICNLEIIQRFARNNNEIIIKNSYPTDNCYHQYLHFNSCHPQHTGRAMPYNLSRRKKTSLSESIYFDIHMKGGSYMYILFF